MIQIKTFPVNPLSENCYVVFDETNEAVIIDNGAFRPTEWNTIHRFIQEKGLIVRHALQTHMHLDHIFGIDSLYNDYGLVPECHEEEQKTMDRNEKLAMDFFGRRISLPNLNDFEAIHDNQEIRFGNTIIRAIHTPGHTPGGMCFYIASDGVLFCGDTLFRGSVGRTDLPLGSWKKETESITKRILTLPPQTRIYPGHGESTTVEYEQTHNPYLR